MIKTFEAYNNYREIDIYELHKNVEQFHTELGINYNEIYGKTKKLFDEIFTGKSIEFQRCENPIDGDVTYNEKGILEFIRPRSVIMGPGSYILKLENFDILYKLSIGAAFYPIIKVYDSKETKMELEIKRIKADIELRSSVDKYNL